MTTVVYRNGVMAGDRRAYGGDKTPVGSKTKIQRLQDGTLFGCSSNNVGADAMLRRWIEAGCPAPESGDLKPDSFELILVRPSGEVFMANGNLDLTGPLEADFYAIGSGSQYALGAMAMGAGPERAVEIACDMDIWSGGGADALSLEP